MEQRFLTPAVIVVASAEVEQACEKNGLGFQQLLAPFARCANDIYARVGDRTDSTVIRKFALRLFRADNLRELEPRLRMEHFTELLKENAQLELAYGEQLDPVLVNIANSTTPVEPQLDSRAASTLLERSAAQWHDQFILDYLNVVRCSYFDTIDHPVGYILAVSASLSSSEIFDQINALEAKARATRDGVPPMDDDPHVYVLVVHDRTSGTSNADADRVFGEVQSRFAGNRCAYVHLNSSVEPRRQCDPGPFVDSNCAVDCYATNGSAKRYRRVEAMFPAAVAPKSDEPPAAAPTSPGTAAAASGMFVTGCYLSNEDWAELRSVMSFYISQALVPHIERKLRTLFQSINEKRQSTFSKVAAWFKKDEAKPKSELFVLSQEPGVPAKYLYGSLEIQMRRAGDLCMMLRDFDTASSYFRMCRDELTSTAAQRDFNKQLIAAAQDAIGLALYFQGKLTMPGNQRNDCRLELAREEYSKAGVHSYAFRTSLILFLICRLRVPPANDRAVQVLQTILRAPGGISANKLYAPILHELCASVTLFTNPPTAPVQGVVVAPGFSPICNVRKYARLLCIAGSGYAEAGLTDLALRSYLRALRVYARCTSSSSFPYIFEHVHLTVAQLFLKCSRSTRAMGCFALLMAQGSPQLSSPHGSARMLDIYTKNLIQWMNERERVTVPYLAAPAFSVTSIQVAHAGGVANATADDVTEQEEKLLGDAATREWSVLDDACRSFYGDKTQLVLPTKSPLTSPFSPSTSSASQATHKKPSPSGQQAGLMSSLGDVFSISILATNPLGVPVTAEDIALLYSPVLSTTTDTLTPPTPLTRGLPISTVTIPALRSERLVLSISPAEAGDYVIVGLSWTLCGIQGRMLFSAKEAVAGYRETMFEYAAENSSPSVESTGLFDPQRTIRVTFGPPIARLSMRMDPPLPAAARDGQYVRTTLVVENHSTLCAATYVMLMRSPSNAHVTYFPSFSAAENSDDYTKPLSLPNIGPGESVSLPVVYRAQYAGRLSRCFNNLVLSMSYLPHGSTASRPGAVAVQSPVSAAPSQAPKAVRLVRFLRRIVVRPVFNVNSLVSLSGTRSQVATTTLLLYNVGQRSDPPVRVSKLAASHCRMWATSPLNIDNLTRDNAVDCLVGVEQSFSFAAAVSRIPSSVPQQLSGEVADTDLLTPADASLQHSKIDAMFSALGARVANDPCNMFFATKAHEGGAGSVGESDGSQMGGDDFSFYLDKAGGKKADSVIRAERWAAETDLYGAPLRQYPPILFSISWRSDEDGHTSFGMLFHFVDVAGRLLRPLTTKDWIVKNVPTLISVPQTLAAPSYVSALAEAFRTSETVADRSRASLLVHCDRPKVVQNSPTSPHVAFVKVIVQFRCLCPVPLRVEVTFREPQFSPFAQQQGASLTFCGKSKVKFLVLPDDSYCVAITGSATSPGLYNCNTMEVKAMPVKFSPGLVTGPAENVVTTAVADSSGKGGLLEKLAVLGAETPWPCLVQFVHPTRGIELGNFNGTVLASSHSTPETLSATSQLSTLKTSSATAQKAPGSEQRERSMSTIVRRARGTSLIQSSQPSVIIGSRNSMRNANRAAAEAAASSPQLSHSFAPSIIVPNDSGQLEHPQQHANASFTAATAAPSEAEVTNDVDMGDDVLPDERSPSLDPAQGIVVELAAEAGPSSPAVVQQELYGSPAASPRPAKQKRRNVFDDSSSEESDSVDAPDPQIGTATKHQEAASSQEPDDPRQAASVDETDIDVRTALQSVGTPAHEGIE